MTPQAYLYICDDDIDNPVLTHKKMDWPEKYPHWQEIPLVMAQQAEPVACGYDETTGNCTNNPCCYTAPPPRQPLTDEEILKVWEQAIVQDNGAHARLDNQPFVHFARAIEAKLKEKNNA